MTHSSCRTNTQPDARLARSLWQWLCLGVLLTLCVPAARGDSAVGPLPFWLLVAPLLGLLVAYRQTLRDAWRGRSQTGRGRHLVLH